MSTTIEHTFATRELADRAVEHLVQQHGFERTDIFVSADGAEASAGSEVRGGDAPTPGEGNRNDAPLGGAIRVSIDVQDDTKAVDLRAVLEDIN